MLNKNKKKKIIIGLKKAQSGLERIIKIMEDSSDKENDRCFSIMQQILSIIGLLKVVNIGMLENHLNSYIQKNIKGKISKKELLKIEEEILKIVRQAQNK